MGEIFQIGHEERETPVVAFAMFRLHVRHFRCILTGFFRDIRDVRKGLESLVRRYQSGDLQESLEKRFSIKHIKDVEGELERGIEKVGNATQQVLKALSENKTSIKGIEDVLNDTGLLTQVVKAGHSSEQKNLRH